MPIVKDSPHSRVSSLLSLRSDSPSRSSPRSSEEHAGPPATQGLRPLPSTRDGGPQVYNRGGPHVHNRLPSIELHNSQSNQNLRSISRDTSHGINNWSPGAPRSSTSNQTFHPSTPQLPTPSYTSPMGASPWGASAPAHPPLHPYAPPSGDDLVPPPRIGDPFSERPSSPTSSKRGSIPRGRQDNRTSSISNGRASSPTPGSDGTSPTTPTEGKLSKKRSWMPGRSRNGSVSEASIGPSEQAWVVTPHGQELYDSSYLLKAQPVSGNRHQTGNVPVLTYDF
jgi:hypothetical protein